MYKPGEATHKGARQMKPFHFLSSTALATSLWVGVSSCTTTPKETDRVEVNLRLQWVPQAQFAGEIVALVNGYYDQEGLNIHLLPAGPDLKPHVTVANGTDQIGVGVPNQVITARANGVPLVVIAQLFQDSPNRYILKEENHVDSLQQLRQQKVGLWLGGDEAEFVAMLASAGMRLSDVQVISQGFSVAPFLQDEYKLSMVTTYNELGLLEDEYKGQFQILSPKDYDAAILGDMLFTTETYMKQNPETVRKFLRATIRGWQYALENPEATVDLLVKYNPELDRGQQEKMLKATNELITAGQARTRGIGYLNPPDYNTAYRVLRGSGQLSDELDVSTVYDMSAWNSIPDSLKLPR